MGSGAVVVAKPEVDQNTDGLISHRCASRQAIRHTSDKPLSDVLSTQPHRSLTSRSQMYISMFRPGPTFARGFSDSTKKSISSRQQKAAIFKLPYFSLRFHLLHIHNHPASYLHSKGTKAFPFPAITCCDEQTRTIQILQAPWGLL